MLKLKYVFKFILTLLFILSLSNTSLGKEKSSLDLLLNISSHYFDEDEDTEKVERQNREDKFQECMISKIKPESTDAHKSVVEEYCWNKVKKR